MAGSTTELLSSDARSPGVEVWKTMVVLSSYPEGAHVGTKKFAAVYTPSGQCDMACVGGLDGCEGSSHDMEERQTK